ncbi:DeoR family transcriptional regulator [Rhodohalobacter sp. SW132]|uniref:helix-turn-helix transcriptional regulator n=1 Tax=Rhodohalobacter sp. SW132 TaxID=2293433 RepID=UPI000E235C90|nr:methanogen output domain 1-containing protein [Rhodohalobacter sp. SW132]REL38602.1 DeoR family transcriptional regulator [Rhodohalobacter sp. SW132]
MIYTGPKKDLLDLIKQKGTLSMDEAVTHTELAKTTLREHFLQLERYGYIRREYIRSGPGRPSLQYQITPKGNRLFPSSESDLIRELLKFLKEQGDEQTIEQFFESFWEERLKKARNRMDEASENDLKSQLDKLMGFLEEEGFMPEAELDSEDGTITIKECNCPFREVVKETRLPCKLEAMFYRKLFNKNVERTSYIADGDFSCTYEIPVNG